MLTAGFLTVRLCVSLLYIVSTITLPPPEAKSKTPFTVCILNTINAEHSKREQEWYYFHYTQVIAKYKVHYIMKYTQYPKAPLQLMCFTFYVVLKMKTK